MALRADNNVLPFNLRTVYTKFMLPILYSFRRCPYAIRARMALFFADANVRVREVSLKDKPTALLKASPKGTVPVLIVNPHTIIDESLDIMHWAFAASHPELCLKADELVLIKKFDCEFKPLLDAYKYHDPSHPQQATRARNRALQILRDLEQRLQSSPFLSGQKMAVVDIALFPFVRQFAMVDAEWFASTALIFLNKWLVFFLDNPLFLSVMKKYPLWKGDAEPYLIPK